MEIGTYLKTVKITLNIFAVLKKINYLGSRFTNKFTNKLCEKILLEYSKKTEQKYVKELMQKRRRHNF